MNTHSTRKCRRRFVRPCRISYRPHFIKVWTELSLGMITAEITILKICSRYSNWGDTLKMVVLVEDFAKLAAAINTRGMQLSCGFTMKMCMCYNEMLIELSARSKRLTALAKKELDRLAEAFDKNQINSTTTVEKESLNVE